MTGAAAPATLYQDMNRGGLAEDRDARQTDPGGAGSDPDSADSNQLPDGCSQQATPGPRDPPSLRRPEHRQNSPQEGASPHGAPSKSDAGPGADGGSVGSRPSASSDAGGGPEYMVLERP